MKLIILQEKLKEGLGIVEKISSKSLTLPILNNILISTEKNFLRLSATDLEVGINWWALGKIEKEGKITVPSRVFSGLINILPNEKVNISVKGSNLLIDCKNQKTQIAGISAEEFPIIPKINEGESVSILASSFCENLSRVTDIASPSTTRPEISGIYLSFQKNLITMVATDSFRLGEQKVFLKNNISLKGNYSLILPQKAAREILNIFTGEEGELKIYFSSNQIMIESSMPETNHPQVQIISRLIEGEYPNYEEIIPQKFTTKITLSRNDFLNQIKGASFFSGKTNEIKIKTDKKKNTIEIYSQNTEAGKYNSLIKAGINGNDTEVSFNYKFLIDGVSSLKDSDILLELNGDSGPGAIKSLKDDTFIYIIMPIRSL